MSSPTNNSGLRDNHTRGTVADFLRGKCQEGSQLSIVSAYFTIYAYDALKAELERIEHLNFLFGEPSFINRLDPSKTEKKAFIIDAAGLELSNKLQQKRVAKECADWIDRKVDIRTIRQANLLHGKMYHVATAGVEDAVLGSSNFTVRGLGLGNSGNNIELNLIVDGNRDRQELKQWFEELWGNETLVKDVKQDVLNYLINYDIHWNPVRIIQRFGRIDRIGSPNSRVQLVNFWPDMELEEYINLEQRVSGRMVLLDISATGEENIIEQQSGNPMNDLEYRRRQLLKLQDAVIDLEDLSSGVSIADLTLTDFRIDLAQYLREQPGRLEALPMGSFAVVTSPEVGIPPGVVFCLRSDATEATGAGGYPLAPHYLVHVGDDGAVLLAHPQVKRILDRLKRLCIGRDLPDAAACTAFDRETRLGQDMTRIVRQLAAAVASVCGKQEERAVESLFVPGGTHGLQGEFAGIEDFEVLCFVVIRAATPP